MTLTDTMHFPLSSAYVCGDCHTVCNSAIRCPSCASEHGLASLATILNRTIDAVLGEDHDENEYV